MGSCTPATPTLLRRRRLDLNTPLPSYYSDESPEQQPLPLEAAVLMGDAAAARLLLAAGAVPNEAIVRLATDQLHVGRVTGLVRDPSSRPGLHMDGIAGRIALEQGSVEDIACVERVLETHRIDSVFHLAAQALVGVANRDPLGTFEANIKGTWTVLDACRRSATVSRIVIASSDKAYGAHAVLPYQESYALQGRHPYDVSKSCADLIAMTYHTTWRTPVSITRCGNIFGPRDMNFSRIIPGTIRAALHGERPVIRSDGSPVRDYLSVQDAVSAYLSLAERMDDPAIHGQAFNFGTGEPVSVLDLTRRVLAAAGRADLEPLVQNNASSEIHRQYLSSDRARDVLGWRPGAPLDIRLRETVAWYRARPDLLGGLAA